MQKKYIVSSLLLAAIVSLAPNAHAAQPGLYAGVGLGQGDAVVMDQTSAALKIFSGYNFNPFLGVEVAYVDLGSNYIDSRNNTLTLDGLSFDIAGYLPVSPTVDIFGKVGILNWELANTYSYYAYSQGTSNAYGFGIDAEVKPAIWIRGEYQKFINVLGGDANLASVNMLFYF